MYIQDVVLPRSFSILSSLFLKSGQIQVSGIEKIFHRKLTGNKPTMPNNRSNCVNLVPLLARGQVNGLTYQIPTVTSILPRILRDFFSNSQLPHSQTNRWPLGPRSVAFHCALEKPNQICYIRLSDVFGPVLELYVFTPNLLNQKGIRASEYTENDHYVIEDRSMPTDPSTEVTYIHENASLEFSGAIKNLLFVSHSSILSPDHSRFRYKVSFWCQKPGQNETGRYISGEPVCSTYTHNVMALNEDTSFKKLITQSFVVGYQQFENKGYDILCSYMAVHGSLIKSLHCKHRARHRACIKPQPLENGVHLSAFDIRYCEPNFYPRPLPFFSISTYSNGHIRFVNYDSRVYEEVSYECPIHDQQIRTIRHHPTNLHQFVVSGDSNFLRLYDVRMFAPDGSVSGGNGQLRGAQPVQLFTEHRSTHHHHQISLDSSTNLLVSSGSDNLVRFWNANSGKLEYYQKYKQPDNPDTLPVQAFYCGDFWLDSAHRSEALFTVNQGEHRLFFSNFLEHCFNMDAYKRRSD